MKEIRNNARGICDGRNSSEKTGGVASLVIDRPPLNVLNLALLRQLRQILDELDRDNGVELVEIRGAGERAFSAGVDVKDHTRAQVPEMLDLVHGVIRKLMSLRQPTVAVVDGVCLGGGCELASSCDLVLASDDSLFATPEITVGCFPPVALARFSSQIGYHRAAEMILTGRRLSAQEAASIGLINRVVPREQLDHALEELRNELLTRAARCCASPSRACGRSASRSSPPPSPGPKKSTSRNCWRPKTSKKESAPSWRTQAEVAPPLS